MDKLPEPNQHNLPQPYSYENTGAMAPYDPYRTDQNDDEIDLREIWRIIVKHRRTILLFTTIVLITTLFATLMLRPVYRATTLIEITPNSHGMVKFQNVEENDLQPLEYRETQTKILQSESVAQAVIDKHNLLDHPEFNGKLQQRGLGSGLRQIKTALVDPLTKMVSSSFRDSPTAVTEKQDPELIVQRKVLDKFSKELTVSLIRRSNLFEVSFDTFDPELSATLANTVASEYIRLNDERRFQSGSSAKNFLQREIQRVQGKLETSEKELTEFARKHQVVDLEDKNNIMSTRLQDLNNNLTEVKSDRITAEALYNQAQSANIETLPSILQEDLIKTLKAEYTQLRSEYMRMSGIYKPKYPKLQQLGAQVEQIKTSLNQEVANIVASLQVNYEQLTKKEQLLDMAVEQQKTLILDLQNRAVQYNILKREWETNKELYSGLLERMKEISVTAGMELNNIAIIDQAAVPIKSHKPKLALNLGIAGVLGLMGGLGLAFLLAFLDNTVRSPEELEKVVHLANLGLVPKVHNKDLPEGTSLDLLSHQVREKELPEAFRSIRTSLMFSSPGGAPKSLMVTSVSKGEGKSTTAINLAIVLAQNNASVLLLDADLRLPRLHKAFGVPRGPGLTEYLVNDNLDAFYETEIPNLTLLTAGTPPPNPAELLSAENMDKLLQGVGESFDYVIVDTPPILGLADPLILSTKVQGVILVTAAGQVSKGALRDGVRRMRSVRAPLIGAVLNQVEPNSSEYGYYNRYYYNYGSESKDLATA